MKLAYLAVTFSVLSVGSGCGAIDIRAGANNDAGAPATCTGNGMAQLSSCVETTDGGAAATDAAPFGVCTLGRDQTCNEDVAMSSFAGICMKTGVCACNPGYVKISSGTCAAGPTASVCTPGMDQTCNEDVAMSSFAGSCNSDHTCTCKAGFAKKTSGKCGAVATTFPDYLPGNWLIGWSGGYDHFSWVRLEGAMQGRADFLSVASTRGGYTPYFGCSGEGTWAWTQKPNTIQLVFPAGCPAQPPGVALSYTFGPVTAAANFPKGAVLSTTFEGAPGTQELLGFKFADIDCNAAFTSCVDPFQ